ncbi:MAG: DUF2520 domain-containing protein [Prevotella sp.]|nr:DUF2520 domain-containing protein [Prevotella sp.]
MKFVFVGAGRLATQLSQALCAAGHEVTAVYSRTMTSAEGLASIVGGVATDSIGSLPLHADAFIIAVKDAVITQLLSELIPDRSQEAFFHTAGSIPMSVFATAGASRYGVIYPMQTFSKERKPDFHKIPVFVEANNDETLRLAHYIAESVSDRVTELPSDDRRHLHLAAVFASNFVNHCYALSAQILEAHGLTFDTMLPLIEETAEKVKTMHPLDAQTGPAVRFDEQVIAAQSSLLAEWPMVREVYDLMSKSIHASKNPQPSTPQR